MFEQEDFKIRDKQQGLPVKLEQTWLQWFICLITPKPKPAEMRMPDLRIQNNSYGDTEIKVKPWGRRYGNYSGTLDEQFGEKEED